MSSDYSDEHDAMADMLRALRDRLDLLQKSRRRWIDAIAAVFPPDEEQPKIEALWNDCDQAECHMRTMRQWLEMRAESAERERDRMRAVVEAARVVAERLAGVCFDDEPQSDEVEALQDALLAYDREAPGE